MPGSYSLGRGIKDFFTLCSGKIPGQIVIQFTDRCNASCPQCDMNINNARDRYRLSNQVMEEIIALAASRGIRSISFTGGEPFLYYEDLRHLIACAHQANIPFIRTGTNGFFLRKSESQEFADKINKMAVELAASGLRNLWISIDSADPKIHEEIRGLPGVIKGIRHALPLFHAHGLYPAANLGINRLTGGSNVESGLNPEDFLQQMKTSISSFFEFVLDLGFTMANVCYPMSSEGNDDPHLLPVYGAHSAHSMVNFSQDEKILVFQALREVVPSYRHRIRIFTPLSSLYALEKQLQGESDFTFECRGGRDFFYISAFDNQVYPCGYRGREGLGSLDNLQPLANTSCRLCEWECFRDPSELMGSMTSLLKPGAVYYKFKNDPTYARYWWSDLKYYNACKFFDGRVEPSALKFRDTDWGNGISAGV
ncbi:MAG: radical SAM protein [Syntrophomonadaceae bacterium]|nr:radical SAM protein [Syntrophomonadaceae bacterium]